MTIRRDVVFVSSVLFTIALICLVPSSLENAKTGHHSIGLDPGFSAAAQLYGDLGFASLAIILIGLIVTWTGYVKKTRWAWLVMFIIVWVWAFPLMILPSLEHRVVPTLSELLSSALREPGIRRDFVETILNFALLVVALALPIPAFFSRQPPKASHS